MVAGSGATWLKFFREDEPVAPPRRDRSRPSPAEWGDRGAGGRITDARAPLAPGSVLPVLAQALALLFDEAAVESLRAGLERCSGAAPAVPVGAVDRDGTRVVFGEVEVDPTRREVRRAGAPVHLTSREYRLLSELIRHRGEAVTHRTLLEAVWGPSYVRETHYVRVYVCALRKKLEVDAGRPRFLLTESGVGYRLIAEEVSVSGGPGPSGAT